MSLFNWPLLVTAILLGMGLGIQAPINAWTVSYTHLRAHETP